MRVRNAASQNEFCQGNEVLQSSQEDKIEEEALLNALGKSRSMDESAKLPSWEETRPPNLRANGMPVSLKMDIRAEANVMPIKL